MIFMKIQKNIIPQIKKRMVIVFDDKLADMESNKKASPIFNELF